MACYVEACQHEARYLDGSSCACHLDIEFYMRLPEADRVDAIRWAALENDEFEVDGDGDIRLSEEVD